MGTWQSLSVLELQYMFVSLLRVCLDRRNSKGIMEEYIPIEMIVVLVFGTREPSRVASMCKMEERKKNPPKSLVLFPSRRPRQKHTLPACLSAICGARSAGWLPVGWLASPLTKSLFTSCQNSIFLSQ